MSDQDRGAYTPQNEAPLAFDARRSGGGGGPAPMTLLVSGIILMAMIVALLIFYRHGMRHAGQPPQLVGAPVGQTKSPPPPEAAAGDQASGLQVYKSEVAPPSEGKSAPTFETPPEQPAPLPPPRPVQPPPAVMIAPAPPLRGAVGGGATPAPPHPAPKIVVTHAAPPAPAAPKPAPSVAPPEDDGSVAGSAFSRPAQPAHPTQLAAAAPKPAARAASVPAAPKPATAKPVATAVKPVAKPAAPAAQAASAAGGGTMVQIGAFSSAALAEKGWSDDAAALPGKMAGKTRKIEAAAKDGKTFYRAYVGGFASHADAVAFCEALKGKGKACFVK
jgi:hypothetical protein